MVSFDQNQMSEKEKQQRFKNFIESQNDFEKRKLLKR